MTRNQLVAILGAALVISGFLSDPAIAGDLTYEVTVTNIMRGPAPPGPSTAIGIRNGGPTASGQILGGLIVAIHNQNFRLFVLGDPSNPASQGLVEVAEDACTATLAAELGANPDVGQVIIPTGGPILPGTSRTFVFTTNLQNLFLSLAAMLVSTNDGFAALNGVRLPLIGQSELLAVAYDAGSEANTEQCGHVPGPPCTSPGCPPGNDGAPDGGGYISIHNGIHGSSVIPGSDLDAADLDWRNPVVSVRIRRIG